MNRPLRVWLPAVRAGSGADIYTKRLADALQRRGCHTRVDWYSHVAELMPQLMRRRLWSEADLIHANSWSAFAFAKAGVPLVVTVHHCVHEGGNSGASTRFQRTYHRALIKRYERASLQNADAIIAVSEYTRRSVARVFNGCHSEVIYNWVNTDAFRPITACDNDGPYKLLFAGNRSFRKGWDIIPALMSRLGNRFQLNYTAGLRGSDCASQLPPNMIGLPRQPDEQAMVALYQSCDAVLVPSRLEGFGYAAIEAMACGKPVIAFSNSATVEIVMHEQTGLLVATDDVDALAKACRRLADDKALSQRLGQAARKLVEEKFSEEAAVDRYVAVYERLVGRRATEHPWP